MSKVNKERAGCVDVFHSKYFEGLHCKGEYGFPVIKGINEVPRRLIPFSKAMREKKDFHQWVCFYEDDHEFERIWNSPLKYLSQLSRFEGVISPDFSVYFDMPLAMQLWNILRSRVIGAWLQKQGVKVIPNIRFGDERTYRCVCDGISRHSTIAVGSLGCLRVKEYRTVFENGLLVIVDILKPETLIIYGSAPSNVDILKEKGINVVLINPLSFHNNKEVKR